MTIKQFSVLFIAMLTSVLTSSQIAFQKYYFSSPTNVKAKIFETTDSNLVIMRQTIINGIGHFQVIKANQNGDTIWCKTNYDTLIRQYYSATKSIDGNYFVGGVKTDSLSNMSGAIMKIDSAGNVLWSLVLSDSLVTCVTLVQQLNNGDLLISGLLNNYPYLFSSKSSVLRCDSMGNVKWSFYGFAPPCGTDVVECRNGDIIIRGQIPSFHYPDFIISRFDSSGNSLWSVQQNGLLNNSPFYYDVDSTIIAVGSTALLRIDTAGTITDTVLFNFGVQTYSIVRTNDSGYLVASVKNVSFTESYIVFTKVDSLFQVEWQKTIQNYSMENPTTCFQSRSGRYFFMGNVDSYDHQIRGFSLTGFDTTSLNNSLVNNQKLSCNDFYPNPYLYSTQLDLPVDIKKPEFILYDVYGIQKRIIHPSEKIIINRGDLPPGLYFYQIVSQGLVICKGRLIII